MCATRVAHDEKRCPFQVRESEQKIAQDLYRYMRLMADETLSQTVRHIFEGMSARYGRRIGVTGPIVFAEDEKLVAALQLDALLPG